MRARELLENYNQSLESDLTNLLIGAKGLGSTEISTQELVNQLYGMGYSVDVNSIMPMLSQNPGVMNVTPEIITLTKPEGFSGSPEGEKTDSAKRVKDMAMQATEIG